MKEMTFNKGIVSFKYADGKEYSYNINTHTFRNEKTEKELKNYPPCLKAKIVIYSKARYEKTRNNVKYPSNTAIIDDIVIKFGHPYWNSTSLKDVFPIQYEAKALLRADKINSALKSCGKTLAFNDCWSTKSLSSITIPSNEKEQKRFFQVLTKCPTKEFVNNFNEIHDQLKIELENLRFVKYPILKKYKELRMANDLYSWADKMCRKEEYYIDFPINSILKWFLYYYEKYLKFFYYTKLNTYHTSQEMIRLFDNFLQLCYDLDKKPQKENFFTEYMSLQIEYETKRKVIENEKIKKQMTRFDFHFEDDNYIVVVPTTAQEYIDEAREQHNCVERSYLSGIINGNYTVVFVREKSNPEKSFITCEIGDRGQIYQYLKKCNQSVTEPSALEFKRKYQEYLMSVMSAQ
jgi:hypothetical protein